MAVLETMAGVNAAYAIIKTTIENGRELSDCASAIGKFATGKSDMDKHHHEKSNSFWVKLAGTDANDLETFMHKEKVKRMEDNLRQYMQLYGRAGMWGDYQKYCAQARKDRARAIVNKKRAQQKLMNIIFGVLGGVVAAGILSALAFVVYLAITEGNW